MAVKVGLTDDERRIVKGLFARGWRNQDIHAWINAGRGATVNFGRIAGVKQDAAQEAAPDDEVNFWLLKKQSYDQQTGLNRYDDERLIRAREAMILGVQSFNSAGLKFKTEVFTVLANIAWTYLMHEYYERKLGIAMMKDNGFTVPLSELLTRADCPLNETVKRNLQALKILRDDVEHHLLGKADVKWLGLFQACCLNFDKAICDLFGPKLSLAGELTFALQFAKLNMEHAVTLNKYELPPHFEALDARLTEGMTAEQIANLEFQFRVIYTQDAASKTNSHFQFVRPESVEGKDIRNVLAQKVAADELYPHKPTRVASLVQKIAGVPFTTTDHTKARKLFKVRPAGNALHPANTDKKYCLYHPTHMDYTYSDAWVQFLVTQATDPDKLAAIRAVK